MMQKLTGRMIYAMALASGFLSALISAIAMGWL